MKLKSQQMFLSVLWRTLSKKKNVLGGAYFYQTILIGWRLCSRSEERGVVYVDYMIGEVQHMSPWSPSWKPNETCMDSSFTIKSMLIEKRKVQFSFHADFKRGMFRPITICATKTVNHSFSIIAGHFWQHEWQQPLMSSTKWSVTWYS